ncbi:hypothetical protein [Paractinoplanes rishiriensis]|uniref:Uncharacterized protein n=1 Tax=Paractinoplanes rishiriensis TaxID=1050105 RepID=A0A919K4C7_9ACTN|nr:hypothetical protein [Actinoplanes rishiriensis]GIE98607.1 hypothetical protein Ari01nite_60720 [Actinoplanes rishiriensis]
MRVPHLTAALTVAAVTLSLSACHSTTQPRTQAGRAHPAAAPAEARERMGNAPTRPPCRDARRTLDPRARTEDGTRLVDTRGGEAGSQRRRVALSVIEGGW